MGALTGIDDLVNRLSGGSSGTPEHVFFAKWASINGTVSATGAAGQAPFQSMWMKDGIPGGTGATLPGAAAIPDRTTNGGLKQANPGGGRQKWLLGLDMLAADSNQNFYAYLLYDRLFHMSGLDGTLSSAQTVQGASPSPALTRYTGGVGNFIMYEIYTAVGNLNARNFTASYTDQAGNIGHTTAAVTIGGANYNAQNTAQILPLASGDTGVRAVKEVTIAVGTTSAAGNFGITIGHPLAMVFVDTMNGAAGQHDGVSLFPSITEVQSDACLALLLLNSGTNAVGGQPLFGMAHFLEA